MISIREYFLAGIIILLLVTFILMIISICTIPTNSTISGSNTGFEYDTCYSDIDGSYNIIMGYPPPTYQTGSYNIAIGYTSMQNNEQNNMTYIGYTSIHDSSLSK